MSGPCNYVWFRNTPLQFGDRRRLRIAAMLRLLNGFRHVRPAWRAVSLMMGSGRSRDLAERIYAMIDDPVAAYDPLAFGWLVSYSRPALVRELMSGLQGVDTDVWQQQRLRDGDPDLLLASEYRVPDFQSVVFRRPVRKALVVVTGNSHSYAAPLQIYNFVAAERFDQVIYLRDMRKAHFSQGIVGIAEDLDGLARALRGYLADCPWVACTSVSSGGIAAVHLAGRLRAQRLLTLASTFTYQSIDGHTATRDYPELEARLYFARHWDADVKAGREWQKTPLRDAVRWVDSTKHGFFAEMRDRGELPAQADWMAGLDTDGFG